MFGSVTVVGAGAIGGPIAAGLVAAGVAVKVLARGETAALLRAEGLTVSHPGSTATVPVEVIGDGASAGPQDLVVGGLKAHDWPGALDSLKPLIGPHTLVLPALNGVPWWYFDGVPGPLAGTVVRSVDSAGTLMAALPARQVVGCIAYMGSARAAPHIINVTTGHRLVLGEAAAGADPARLAALADLLRRGGLNIETTDDIRREVWTKLLGNASTNPLSVVAGVTMGPMVDEPHLRAVCLEVMAEVAAVAAAVGAPVTVDPVARLDANRALATIKTSTLQDYEAGRRLELGALVEAVAEVGALVGVPTPVTATLGRLAAFRAGARGG
jgi:2-dehydropantoate 2-reductase